MIFVTSGSMSPFDRLFKIMDQAIEDGLIVDTVFGQIGESKYEPRNFAFERFLDKESYDEYLASAEFVIGHAGVGVIMQALESNLPLLVLPRRAELGECVNDHQVATAKKFETMGHLLSFDADNLEEKLKMIDSFVPKQRYPNIAGVGDRVAAFLSEIQNNASG